MSPLACRYSLLQGQIFTSTFARLAFCGVGKLPEHWSCTRPPRRDGVEREQARHGRANKSYSYGVPFMATHKYLSYSIHIHLGRRFRTVLSPVRVPFARFLCQELLNLLLHRVKRNASPNVLTHYPYILLQRKCRMPLDTVTSTTLFVRILFGTRIVPSQLHRALMQHHINRKRRLIHVELHYSRNRYIHALR